jgi:hypothetical protein
MRKGLISKSIWVPSLRQNMQYFLSYLNLNFVFVVLFIHFEQDPIFVAEKGKQFKGER